MKTIEERGLRYVESQCNGCRNEEKKGRYIGYIQGATEQKVIDITKAEDIYCEVCGHYPHKTPNHICRQACDYYKTFHIRLMEAMED